MIGTYAWYRCVMRRDRSPIITQNCLFCIPTKRYVTLWWPLTIYYMTKLTSTHQSETLHSPAVNFYDSMRDSIKNSQALATILTEISRVLLRPRERLRSRVITVSVCLSLCPRGCLRNHTRDDLYRIFVHVACVSGSVLRRHIDNRPHRLSAGRGWREYTARAKFNLRLPCLFLIAKQ